MTHIAIQEQHNGKVVDWMEKASDEQYQGDNQITSDRTRRSHPHLFIIERIKDGFISWKYRNSELKETSSDESYLVW
jgi:hypothetical protein